VVKHVETPYVGSEYEESFDPEVSFDEPSAVARELTEEALVEAWRRFVTSEPKGSFEEVLSKWVAARVEMKIPVNPGPPGKRPSKTPKKEFKERLESEFNDVRSKKRRT